ncbi:hypothetical protein ACFLWA_03295 [Chloroflexota bacterium]
MSIATILPPVMTVCTLMLALGVAPAPGSAGTSLGPEATLPTDISYALGSEMRISPESTPTYSDRLRPAVDWNLLHSEFLVVWEAVTPEGQTGIFGRRVDMNGELLNSFRISAGPNGCLQPAVAFNYNTDEYLVVWMYNANGDFKTFEIWGRLVAWDGSYQKPEFQIITWSNRTFSNPQVVANEYLNEYLVVWDAANATTFAPTDVASKRLSKDGAELSGRIISTIGEPKQADVTFLWTANEYLVVWTRTAAVNNGDIYAARVKGSDGNIVTPPGEFAVNTAAVDQAHPAVSTNRVDRYVVVWQQLFAGPCCDWDIHAVQLDHEGTQVGGAFGFSTETDSEQHPDVAAVQGSVRDYLAVWQRTTATGEELWAGRRTDTPGVGLPFEVSSASGWDSTFPALAYGRPNYLFAYERAPNNNALVLRQIYGRRWAPHGIFLPIVVAGQ